MSRYIIRRLLQSVPVLFGITLVTFFLTEAAPGDAVAFMLINDQNQARGYTPAELRESLGLNAPAPVRYVRWLGGILTGNMGRRLLTREPVTEVIQRHIPATLQLMLSALVISILLGIPLGIVSALRQYSVFDYAATTFVFFALAVPGFFAAIGAIYIFSVNLGWFPSSGYSTPGASYGFWGTMIDRLRYLALPAFVLGLESTGSLLRYTRSSLLETVRADYVTVARSKGLPERVVILRHAFRNAVIPVITIIGLRLPSLLGGSIIMETVFNWPGLGILYIDAISARDYPLIMGMTLIGAIVVVASNLITDIVYSIADPRIRYE